MPTTLTGDRPMTTTRAKYYVARAHEKEHLHVLRMARAQCCGCTRCNDGDRGHEIDVLISISVARITELGNRIVDRSGP